jgi:hypothetical protein
MHPRYEQNNFINELFNSDNIILFGHAMGITDSDYFCDFFTALKKGLLPHKNIYFVTYAPSSMLDIESNLEKIGISINNLKATGNQISSIYTIEGQSNLKFSEILTLL